MTIRELQAKGTALLKSPCASAFIETPALDAALLLAEILHSRREYLLARANDEVTGRDCEKYRLLLARRRSGECVAYILGRKEFRGMEFAVNPKVLVPRPDTETLFEAALEYIGTEEGISVLDLCTGSGALAISLKKERPFISVTASDICPGALETAALNAGRLLNGDSAVSFIQSDIFENLPDRYDIIVSNPPYVPSGEIPNLAPEVQLEPRIALDGGEDGLAITGQIIARAPDHLLPGGVLLLEADPAQMPQIRALLEDHGFTSVRLHRDLADKDRVISSRLQ